MPTVLRKCGFEFYFYSEEGHEPPHVHADKGEGTVKFWLAPVRLVASEGLKPAELRHAAHLVEEHHDYLLERWREFFERKGP